MHLGPHDIALIVGGTIGEAWAIWLVVRRQAYKEFSWFLVYLVLSLITTFVRVSVIRNYATFFYVYWITEAIYAVAAVLVLHQAFHEVFLSFYELWWWFRLLFPAAVALVLSVSIRRVIHQPIMHASRPMEVVFGVARAVNYLEAVLFGLFFGLVVLLGLRWKSYPFGIVEGFGIYALGGLLAFTLRSEFGTKYNTFVKYAGPVAYLLAVLIWLDTFRRPPDPEPQWQLTPQQMLEEARSQLKIVKRFFDRHNHV